MFKLQSTARIEALEKAVKDLEKLPQRVEEEWENHLHKLGQIMARLNARARQEAVSATREEEPTPDNSQPTPDVSEHHLLATMRERTFGGRR